MLRLVLDSYSASPPTQSGASWTPAERVNVKITLGLTLRRPNYLDGPQARSCLSILGKTIQLMKVTDLTNSERSLDFLLFMCSIAIRTWRSISLRRASSTGLAVPAHSRTLQDTLKIGLLSLLELLWII